MYFYFQKIYKYIYIYIYTLSTLFLEDYPNTDESVVFSVGEKPLSKFEESPVPSNENVEILTAGTTSNIDNNCKIDRDRIKSESECCNPDSKIMYHANRFSDSENLSAENNQLSQTETLNQVSSLDQSIANEKSLAEITGSSGRSMRPTQSHPKMSRMPRQPILFKSGRTARSLGSISSENSIEISINAPKTNAEEEQLSPNSSFRTVSSTLLVNKRGSGIIPLSKQINSQDSLKSSNGRFPQSLTNNDSPIDSKGRLEISWII